jgi:hypothetical protein
MTVEKDVIAKLKRLSNIEYCFDADDMQSSLEKINTILNQIFPTVTEAVNEWLIEDQAD